MPRQNTIAWLVGEILDRCRGSQQLLVFVERTTFLGVSDWVSRNFA